MRDRGLTTAPQLAVDDDALASAGAGQDLSDDRHTHSAAGYAKRRTRKKIQPKTKSVPNALGRPTWPPKTAFDRFIATYQAKSPKVTKSMIKDNTELLAFYDFGRTSEL